MEECVKQTIEEAEKKIAELQKLVASLIEYFGGQSPAVVTAPAAEVKRPKANGLNGKSGRLKEKQARAFGIGLKVREPFGPSSLAEALGITKRGGNSQINRWQQLGYVEKVEYGQYRRTASFPGANGKVEQKETKGTKNDLEVKLALALKQRDAAREAGRETIVEMYQAEVDRL